jgi:hypothetical protein
MFTGGNTTLSYSWATEGVESVQLAQGGCNCSIAWQVWRRDFDRCLLDGFCWCWMDVQHLGFCLLGGRRQWVDVMFFFSATGGPLLNNIGSNDRSESLPHLSNIPTAAQSSQVYLALNHAKRQSSLNTRCCYRSCSQHLFVNISQNPLIRHMPLTDVKVVVVGGSIVTRTLDVHEQRVICR